MNSSYQASEIYSYQRQTVNNAKISSQRAQSKRATAEYRFQRLQVQETSPTTASSSQLLSLIALLVVLTLNIPAGVHALNPPAFLAPSLAAPTTNVAYLVLFSRRARDVRASTYGN